jgi:hypothetical protein
MGVGQRVKPERGARQEMKSHCSPAGMECVRKGMEPLVMDVTFVNQCFEPVPDRRSLTGVAR